MIKKIGLIALLAVAVMGTALYSSADAQAFFAMQIIPVSSEIEDGKAILFLTPGGKSILYGSGRWTDHGARVMEHLEEVGVEQIDVLIAPHADAEHIGGHAELVKLLAPDGMILDSGYANDIRAYENYTQAICDNGLRDNYRVVEAGDVINIEPYAWIEVLNPFVAGPNVNPCRGNFLDTPHDKQVQNSLVLRVSYGRVGFLVTAEMNRDLQEILIGLRPNQLWAQVLVLPGIGGDLPVFEDFLDKVQPQVAFLDSAIDSVRGVPNCPLINALAERDISTGWTALNGIMIAFTDGLRLGAVVEFPGSPDPSTWVDCQ